VIDAVIFDLDGLLLESEQVWNAAKERLVRERGGTWKDEAERAMMGMSSPEWSRYMHDELELEDLAPEEISAAVVELLAEEYERELPLLPGADAAVRRLAASRPLGLASSSNREIIDLALRTAGWTDLFAVTVSSEEVARGKPSPDVYLKAARRLGVAPERCAAIEDSAAGIRSASAAGMRVVAIPNEAYPPDDEALGLAAVVLESLDQLEEAVVAGAG
jgi:HAD superfamily hydrolase (TIGR01509 family)